MLQTPDPQGFNTLISVADSSTDNLYIDLAQDQRRKTAGIEITDSPRVGLQVNSLAKSSLHLLKLDRTAR